MTTRAALRTALPILLLALLPAPGRAQVYDIAPTFQASVGSAFSEVARPRYDAWGLMVGLRQSGAWSPNVWFQRYRLESDCVGTGTFDASDGCVTTGWTLSVGPALRFLDTERWTGSLVTQVGVDTRIRSDFTGGAGVHVGVKLGAFEPTAFSRMDVFRGIGYTLVGVGLRVRISNGPAFGDPDWGR